MVSTHGPIEQIAMIRESAQITRQDSGGFIPPASEQSVPQDGLRAERALFADLLQRIRLGDEQAAEILVREFEPIIRREIRFRMKSEKLKRAFDSTDVCQSVLASFFARVAKGSYDVDQPEKLVGLLITMARKKLASRVRLEHRQKRDVRRLVSTHCTELDQLQDGQPSPSQIVSARELLERFRPRLTEEERQLADMRIEGLNWREIADRVGGNADARRVQLARSVERVSRELDLNRDTIRLLARAWYRSS